MGSDDDYTLYSDTGSIYSNSNASTSSFMPYRGYDKLPPLYVSGLLASRSDLLIPAQSPGQG